MLLAGRPISTDSIGALRGLDESEELLSGNGHVRARRSHDGAASKNFGTGIAAHRNIMHRTYVRLHHESEETCSTRSDLRPVTPRLIGSVHIC